MDLEEILDAVGDLGSVGDFDSVGDLVIVGEYDSEEDLESVGYSDPVRNFERVLDWHLLAVYHFQQNDQ